MISMNGYELGVHFDFSISVSASSNGILFIHSPEWVWLEFFSITKNPDEIMTEE